MWEVAGSSRGQTNTVAFAVASVSGSEDYLVFLDKDKKIGSIPTLAPNNLWDIKELTHRKKSGGQVVYLPACGQSTCEVLT